MNVVLPRFLKTAYRKEPIISVLITIGIIDTLIGGLNDTWSLFTFGLGTTGVALALKLWRMQQHPIPQETVVQHYLPPQASNAPLPMIRKLSDPKPPR
jgi:hypothetical protein